MVGIGIDHISITRRLPIDAGVLPAVVAGVGAGNGGPTPAGGRGVSGRGGKAESVTVTATACAPGESELEIHPASPVAQWWEARLAAYLDLAYAALEELAQELLYQHARVLDELTD
jgi:hypothetical protein